MEHERTFYTEIFETYWHKIDNAYFLIAGENPTVSLFKNRDNPPKPRESQLPPRLEDETLDALKWESFIAQEAFSYFRSLPVTDEEKAEFANPPDSYSLFMGENETLIQDSEYLHILDHHKLFSQTFPNRGLKSSFNNEVAYEHDVIRRLEKEILPKKSKLWENGMKLPSNLLVNTDDVNQFILHYENTPQLYYADLEPWEKVALEGGLIRKPTADEQATWDTLEYADKKELRWVVVTFDKVHFLVKRKYPNFGIRTSPTGYVAQIMLYCQTQGIDVFDSDISSDMKGCLLFTGTMKMISKNNIKQGKQKAQQTIFKKNHISDKSPNLE